MPALPWTVRHESAVRRMVRALRSDLRSARWSWAGDLAVRIEGTEEVNEVEVDIGHRHKLQYFRWEPPPWEPDSDLDPQGAVIWHPHQQNPSIRCGVAVYFDLPSRPSGHRPVWQVESLEPLTLSPSVVCKMCGDHGFVREGRWVA